MAVTTPVVSGLLGAGLMYVFDKDSGRRRRAQLRDRFAHGSRQASDSLDAGWRDLRKMTRGRLAEARDSLRAGQVDDVVLQQRARAAIGRATGHPHAIHVEVSEGEAVLSGDVLADDVRPLLRAVKKVHGIHKVHDKLGVHCDAEHVPALQGTPREKGPPEGVWRPAARFVGITSGVALMLGGGSLGRVGGMALLVRCATNQPLRRLVGVGAGSGLITVHKTIHIDAPVEQVYGYLTNLEGLPRFMSHLKRVQVAGDVSHWELEGPAGVSIHWQAETIRREENRSIGWRTKPGATVAHRGLVTLDPVGSATRVSVAMSYTPPGGYVGHAFAATLGIDPKRMLDDDLLRLKGLLEIGHTRAHGEVAIAPEVDPA